MKNRIFEVTIPNKVKQDIKKIDVKAQKESLRILKAIAKNSKKGTLLTGSLNNLYKIDFACAGVQYRIVYKVDEKSFTIIVIHIGTRENFYEELKRRL